MLLSLMFPLSLFDGYFTENLVDDLPKEEPLKIELPDQVGVASWYDYKIDGDVGVYCNHYKEDCYTEHHATCASRDFPRRTMLRVVNTRNGKDIVVKVTDYIEHPDRVIDLSSYAFSSLELLEVGLIDVEIYEVKPAPATIK